MKYVGSKNRIAKDIVPIIQRCIDENNITEYYEPFVGGANVIDKIKCQNRIGNDSNKYLIAFWQEMQNGLDLKSIQMDIDTYKEIRANKDNYPNYLVAIAGILASYNAKWFGGYAKVHKVSDKCIRNYYRESVDNVIAQMPNLQDVQFVCGDYRSITPHNAVVYCDPPYANTIGYKDSIDYDEYWNWARELSKDNIVLCSEYNAPSDFECIWEGQVTTTLDNASRVKATEKLFTYSHGKYAEYI